MGTVRQSGNKKTFSRKILNFYYHRVIFKEFLCHLTAQRALTIQMLYLRRKSKQVNYIKALYKYVYTFQFWYFQLLPQYHKLIGMLDLALLAIFHIDWDNVYKSDRWTLLSTLKKDTNKQTNKTKTIITITRETFLKTCSVYKIKEFQK